MSYSWNVRSMWWCFVIYALLLQCKRSSAGFYDICTTPRYVPVIGLWRCFIIFATRQMTHPQNLYDAINHQCCWSRFGIKQIFTTILQHYIYTYNAYNFLKKTTKFLADKQFLLVHKYFNTTYMYMRMIYLLSYKFQSPYR